MSKILLIIDKLGPDEKAFTYATQLCRSIRADLSVLYISDKGNGNEPNISQDPKALVNTGIERLIAKSKGEGVRCIVSVTSSGFLNEIIQHIETNRDILFAIDNREDSISRVSMKNDDKRLAGDLSVPVVQIHSRRRFQKLNRFNNVVMEVKQMGKALRKIGSFLAIKRKKKTPETVLTNKAINQPHPELQAQETEKARLVVVGNESSFSGEIIDYALEMAERMSYQIIALNTAPLSCDTFKLFSTSRNQVCNDFQSIATQNAKSFEEKADKHGIPFIHVVKFVETDDALEELQAEFGEIGFIVSEPQTEQVNQNRTTNENRASAEICVYSLR